MMFSVNRKRIFMEHDNHQHHLKAADHLRRAAEYHQKANKLHLEGDHEKESHYSYIAYGHMELAIHHAKAAAQHHALHHDGNLGGDNPDV